MLDFRGGQLGGTVGLLDEAGSLLLGDVVIPLGDMVSPLDDRFTTACWAARSACCLAA